MLNEEADTPPNEEDSSPNAPQPASPRRRMQELLAIPDNQRSEAEWDELNELEIRLAPGNRLDGSGHIPRPQQGPGGGGSAQPNAGQKRKKPFKKFQKKPAAKPGPV